MGRSVDFEQLTKAIWLECLFCQDMAGEELCRVRSESYRRQWLRHCERSGYLHASVFR